MPVIRGEQWELSIGPQFAESAIGTVVYSDAVLYPSYIVHVPGIFSSATLPDPGFEFEPHWGLGTESLRNWYIAYKGKATLTGSVGDILLLNATPLRYGIGPMATTATAANTLGSTTMDAAASAGAGLAGNGIPVTATTNFAIGDVIRVGNANAWNVEYHMVETVNVGVDLEIYEHIEVTATTGDFDVANQVQGAGPGRLTPVFSTPTEIHGTLDAPGFVVGETVTQLVSGIQGTVTRVETGLKWDHANGDAVVECDDIANNSEDNVANPNILAGSVSFNCLTAGDWATGDYVCIGYGSKYAEIRTITLAGTVMSFTDPLVYNHSGSAGLTDIGTSAPSFYTHTITEDWGLSPFQISAVYTDTDNHISLQRRYIGAKVNRQSFRAGEGDPLRTSWDDVISRTMEFADYAGTTIAPWSSTNITRPTVSYPTTEPYYFSYGQLTFAGSEFARVREFNLEVSNNIEAKYYVNDDNTVGRVPYELMEGRREYRSALTVDIEDSAFFLDLLRQGDYSSVYTGFQVQMVFTRGNNDTITFLTPPSTPAIGGDSMGCLIRTAPHSIVDAPLVSVPLDVLCRSVQITIVDSIQSYP